MTDTHLGFLKIYILVQLDQYRSYSLAVFIMAHICLCPNKLELRVQGNFGLTAALENILRVIFKLIIFRSVI